MFAQLSRALPRRTALLIATAGPLSLPLPGALAQDAGAAQEQQGTPAAQARAEVTPEAQRVLDRLTRFYEGLPGASVRATFSVKNPDPDGGPANERKTEISMAAADPNKFIFPLKAEGEFERFKIVSTGEKLFIYYGAPLNKYVEREAPNNMDEVIDAMSQGEAPDLSAFTSPIFPFLKLMGGTPLAEIEGTQRIEFVGQEELNGQAHDRIRLIGEQLDVDVWVRTGEQAWVMQIKPDAAKGLAELGEMGKALEAQMPQVMLSFDEWESRDEFPRDTFAFAPPQGAERVESLMEAMQQQQNGGDSESPHAALIGKPAPKLDLEMFGGGKTDLNAAKGKVVILDFWASWCPPCVRGLPVMSRIAEKYRDKGVVFYAVNVEEDEQTIRRFLEKQKLSIPVAMDPEGNAGAAYGVTGIPQTVLIGKDGTVQAVHVGFTPEMEQELSTQVEKLLAGEKLAGAR